MRLNEIHIANITINNKLLEIEPQDYSFSIIDSINKLYATANMTFHDSTGLMQEYLQTTIGSKWKISFGDEKNINESTYRILYNYMDSPELPGYIGGNIDLFMNHEFFNQQSIISEAHKDRISKVIQKLLYKYTFNSLDINDTGNEDIWYQPLVTDAKFIQEGLLPFAYSTNANNTPFYAYITTDNVFHFRNLQSMLDEGVVETIEYKAVPGNLEKEIDVSNYTTQIKKWNTNYKHLWKLQNRKLYSIDIVTGGLLEDMDALTNYPPKANLNTPIINEYKDNITDYSFSYEPIPEGETKDDENTLGYRTYEQRDSQFIDTFLILQPMNPKYHAGKTVQLNIYTVEQEGEQLSKNFSGKYIIIECEHIWEGQGNRAYSKLVLGRKYIQVPSSYLLSPKLL